MSMNSNSSEQVKPRQAAKGDQMSDLEPADTSNLFLNFLSLPSPSTLAPSHITSSSSSPGCSSCSAQAQCIQSSKAYLFAFGLVNNEKGARVV